MSVPEVIPPGWLAKWVPGITQKGNVSLVGILRFSPSSSLGLAYGKIMFISSKPCTVALLQAGHALGEECG